MTAPESAHLPVRSLFNGRYEITRCIGKGGMGAVYEVLHMKTQRRRALKVMLPSKMKRDGLRARFKREATVVAGVESEHIAAVLDAGVDDETGSPFIVMELLEGEEIGQLLERRGTLSAEEVVRHLWQASLALDKTHAAGIVHRDLKPENLFIIQRDDGSACVKLLDFGLAKVVSGGSSGDTTKGIVGTLVYLAPEQIHGRERQGGSTDIYALAQIAYTLLTGGPFWSQAVEEQNFYGVLVTLSEGAKQSARQRAREHSSIALPESFDLWFAKATSIEPGDRHGSCAELVATLADALDVDLPPGARWPVTTASSRGADVPSTGGATSSGVASAGGGEATMVEEGGAFVAEDDDSPAPSLAHAMTSTGRRTLITVVGMAALIVGVGAAVVHVLDRPPESHDSTEDRSGQAEAASSAEPTTPPTVASSTQPVPTVSVASTVSGSATPSATSSVVAPPSRPRPSTQPPSPPASNRPWVPPVTER